MGDETIPGESVEPVERQEAEDELPNHGNNSDDVPISSQAVSPESEEPNRRRKRKRSQPQKYRPKSDVDDTPTVKDESNLYVVINNAQLASLNQPEREENVDTERVNEQRVTVDETQSEREERTSRPGKRRKLQAMSTDSDARQSTWKHRLTDSQGLVLKGAQTVENGQQEETNLKPWESSTLPLIPVFPYRVYAPIYVPECVHEPVYNYVSSRANNVEHRDSSVLHMDGTTTHPSETGGVDQSEWMSHSSTPTTTSSDFGVPTNIVANSLSQFAGQVCFPLAKTGSVVITTYPDTVVRPSVVPSKTLKKRSTKEYMRAKRSDPNFRAAEVKLTRERMQRARQDPVYREKERARHREQQRARRSDPGYAARLKEKRKERHQKARLQPDFRLRERERQREYMRAKRANPEYREKERESKRSKKHSNSSDAIVTATSPDTSVNERSNTQLDSSTNSDAFDRLRACWSSQSKRNEWTVTSPTNHVIPGLSKSDYFDTNLTTLPKRQSDSNLNTFNSSANINYVRYDDGQDIDGDRDSNGAGGCRIGSASPTVLSVDVSRSDSSSVVPPLTYSPYFPQDNTFNSSSLNGSKSDLVDNNDDRICCETNGDDDRTPDDQTSCNSLSSSRSGDKHEATESVRQMNSVSQSSSGANVNP